MQRLREIRWSYIALAVVLPMVVGLGLIGFMPGVTCPWHHYLGIECPMCGSTRAWLALARGDWESAFRFNPIFWLWGFWTALAYLELWQRAILPRTVPIGTHLVRQMGRSRTWFGIHVALIVATAVYLNCERLF